MADMPVCGGEARSPSRLSTASEEIGFMANLLVFKDQQRRFACGINQCFCGLLVTS